MTDDLGGQLWFLRALILWAVVWAVLEYLRVQRRRKRDKYHFLNEDH